MGYLTIRTTPKKNKTLTVHSRRYDPHIAYHPQDYNKKLVRPTFDEVPLSFIHSHRLATTQQNQQLPLIHQTYSHHEYHIHETLISRQPTENLKNPLPKIYNTHCFHKTRLYRQRSSPMTPSIRLTKKTNTTRTSRSHVTKDTHTCNKT